MMRPRPPTVKSAERMAVDWYEAAAIEAVGTSSDVELSNTEFVGYDARRPPPRGSLMEPATTVPRR